MKLPFTIMDIEQGSNEWLELRTKCIGASDIPYIMGIVKEKNPYTLWLEKTGRKKSDEVNELMLRGKELEPIARCCAQAHFDGTSLDNPVIIHNEYPWALASLDGLDRDRTLLLEIKCPHSSNFKKIKQAQTLPERYIYQCQWQLFVSDLAVMKVMIFSEEEHFYLTVLRDEDLIKEIFAKAKEFHEFVVMDIEPPTELDQHIYRPSSELSSLYYDLLLQEDELKKKIKELRPQILDKTDGGNYEDDHLSVTWTGGKKSVNYEQFLLDNGFSDDDLAPYVKFGSPFPTIRRRACQ